MIRFFSLLILFLGSLDVASGPQNAMAQIPEVPNLRVMAWNIWHGGRENGEVVGPRQVIDVIRESKADIVAMQETYGSGERIAEALKFHFQPRGTNVSIHSRYPILEDISVHEEFKCAGALIELPDSQQVAFYSIWLPYGAEIWEQGTRDISKPDEMRSACQASADDLQKILDQIETRLSDPKYRDVPIIIAGDFNSMSHLDYTPVNEDQFGVSIDWPTSHVLIDAGFRDSYRQHNPVVDRMRDRTWTPRFPEQEQDRIDYVYYRGATLNVVDSRVIDSGNEPFPSDHAAVLTEFTLTTAAPINEFSARVVSYNIRHGEGMDGKVDLERTGKVLEALNADFICLQEVDYRAQRSGEVNQAAELGKQLGQHAAFGSFMDFQGGKYGLGLLSRYPIINTHTIRLPDGNEPRVALAAEVRLPAGDSIMLVCLHFDWVGDDKFRFAQASKLVEYLDSLTIPALVIGDFNDTPESRTMKLFGDRGVQTPDLDFTFSSTNPVKKIDYIIAMPKSAWEITESKVINEPIASDHSPLLNTVILNRRK